MEQQSPEQLSASNPPGQLVVVQSNSGSEVDTKPAEATEEGFNPLRLLGMVQRKALMIGILAIAVSAAAGFKTAKEPPRYESFFRLLVEPVTDERELSRLTDGRKTEQTKSLDYATQIEVLQSPEILNPLIKQINQQFPGVDYNAIMGKFSVNRLGETKILEVRFSDTNPKKVETVLEKISQGYLKYSLEDQKTRLRQGVQFVDKQLPALRDRVDVLQKQLQKLRQDYNFVQPDTYAEQLSSQLTIIAQQRQAIRGEVAALQIRFNSVKATQENLLSQSPTYQASLQQYQVLARQIALESARLGDKNPTIQLLRQQQANLLPLLQQEVDRTLANQLATISNDIQVLNARDQTLEESESQLNALFKQMPLLSRQYTELQRELKVATESLNRFLETREVLEIQSAQNEIPWQLITPPKPPESKAKSNFYKSLLTGAVAGIVLGAVLAFLLEKLENTFYSVEELKQKTRLPLLGVIPFRPDLKYADPEVHIVDLRHQIESPVQSSSSENSEAPIAAIARRLDDDYAYPFLEACRSLYTNLSRLGKHRKVRSLVISSALTEEGKTIVAVHLAQAAAAMGRRVLLIDTHFRRSGAQVHTLLGLSNKVGLSHYLLGEASLTEVTHQLVWEPSLYVINAGASLPDPTRVLSSPKMADLMQQSNQDFDLVLYDMPPLMGLADVSLVAAQTDGVILVVKAGRRGNVAALTQTLERLQIAHIPVTGFVANGVKNYSVDLYEQSS